MPVKDDAVRSTLAASAQLARQVGDVFFAEALFDRMSDIVFFVKDCAGRYVVVNQTLVQRCGLRSKQAVLGRTAEALFPAALAASYAAQDALVLSGKRQLFDQLELHLYTNRRQGWCLTQKIALYDKRRNIIGMTGISRDLAAPDRQHPQYAAVALALRYLQEHYARAVSMAELAALSGLSVARLEHHFRKIFSLTPRQMMLKLRLDAAARLLSDPSVSITEVALTCGYQDHSAFSRIFKATVGMTPSAYRAHTGPL